MMMKMLCCTASRLASLYFKHSLVVSSICEKHASQPQSIVPSRGIKKAACLLVSAAAAAAPAIGRWTKKVERIRRDGKGKRGRPLYLLLMMVIKNASHCALHEDMDRSSFGSRAVHVLPLRFPLSRPAALPSTFAYLITRSRAAPLQNIWENHFFSFYEKKRRLTTRTDQWKTFFCLSLSLSLSQTDFFFPKCFSYATQRKQFVEHLFGGPGNGNSALHQQQLLFKLFPTTTPNGNPA